MLADSLGSGVLAADVAVEVALEVEAEAASRDAALPPLRIPSMIPLHVALQRRLAAVHTVTVLLPTLPLRLLLLALVPLRVLPQRRGRVERPLTARVLTGVGPLLPRVPTAVQAQVVRCVVRLRAPV